MHSAAPPGAGTSRGARATPEAPARGAARGLFERVAIIVPFYNAAGTLSECFSALTPCAELGAEIYGVDDGSEDASVEIAAAFPAVRLLRHDRCDGVGPARNTAALSTSREFLLFVDSDVVVSREEAQRLVQRLDADECDAVVGCYGESHDHPGLFSQYKNLWIRHSYLHGPRDIDWLWCAFCAMRRDHFLRAGGFNEHYREIDGGEDFELGWRMSAQGSRLALDPTITGRHLKRFTLRSLLANDFRRARGYSTQALTLRREAPVRAGRFANIRAAYLLAGALTLSLPVGPVLAVLLGASVAGAGLLALSIAATWTLLQLRFLGYFAARRGVGAALAALPILYLDQLASIAGAITGGLAWLLGARSPGGPGIR